MRPALEGANRSRKVSKATPRVQEEIQQSCPPCSNTYLQPKQAREATWSGIGQSAIALRHTKSLLDLVLCQDRARLVKSWPNIVAEPVSTSAAGARTPGSRSSQSARTLLRLGRPEWILGHHHCLILAGGCRWLRLRLCLRLCLGLLRGCRLVALSTLFLAATGSLFVRA